MEKKYGGGNYDVAHSAVDTKDGGYIVASWTKSSGVGGVDVYLIKTDSSGNSIWTKTYGGVNDDYGYSVAQTKDGRYIVAGGTNSTGAGGYDIYLIKTDSSGNSK